jgi:plasmid stability protein
MGTVTVRNLDDDVIREIGVQAAEHGVSREEELRRIITRAAQGRRGDIWEKMAKLREETRGTKQTDSAILLRQDRDSH